MKKAQSVLLQQGVGILLFIILTVITFTAIAKITHGNNTNNLLLDFNQALDEAAKLQVGEKTNVLLSLPQNSAIISMNSLSGFYYESPTYQTTSGTWLYGNTMERPRSCSNLNTCTCICTGFNPQAASMITNGTINCEELFCLDGEYAFEEKASMQDIFEDDYSNIQNPLFANRNEHYFVNSSIIARSTRQINEPSSLTFIDNPSTPSNFGIGRTTTSNMIPVISGYQFPVGSLLDVTIIKVEEPNVLRLCFKDSC
jgi:hypothetical protein